MEVNRSLCMWTPHILSEYAGMNKGWEIPTHNAKQHWDKGKYVMNIEACFSGFPQIYIRMTC